MDYGLGNEVVCFTKNAFSNGIRHRSLSSCDLFNLYTKATMIACTLKSNGKKGVTLLSFSYNYERLRKVRILSGNNFAVSFIRPKKKEVKKIRVGRSKKIFILDFFFYYKCTEVF